MQQWDANESKRRDGEAEHAERKKVTATVNEPNSTWDTEWRTGKQRNSAISI